MMRLLVFDPGETTGWSFLADGKIIGGSFPLWEEVPELIVKHHPTVVLFEAFNLRANAAQRLIGSAFPTIQVIGVIKYLTHEFGATLRYQSPSMRMGIYLRRLPGMDKHARDAAKHGVRYLVKMGLSGPYEHYRVKRSDG